MLTQEEERELQHGSKSRQLISRVGGVLNKSRCCVPACTMPSAAMQQDTPLYPPVSELLQLTTTDAAGLPLRYLPGTCQPVLPAEKGQPCGCRCFVAGADGWLSPVVSTRDGGRENGGPRESPRNAL